MMLKPKFRMVIAAACVLLAVGWGSVGAAEIPLVNGKHWTESSEAAKNAYLIGITNLAEVEFAYGAGDAGTDNLSVIPRLLKGLKGQTLDSARQTLDRWYATNPDRLQRPVLETIWFEMVVPGLKNAK